MILYARTPFCKEIEFRRHAFAAAIFLLLSLFVSCEALAATAPTGLRTPPMTLSHVVDNLLARNAKRARDLEDYRGRRTYNLIYRGFPGDLHATMVVDMEYEAPNTKEFKIVSQSGPKLLVDRVLKRLVKTETDAQRQKTRAAVNLDRQNYNFTDLDYEPAADGCSYVVSVAPKHPNKYLYRGKIWINDQDFAVCRIQAQPAENPSFWIRRTAIAQTYEKVGEFWLPEKNTSVSNIRLGGRATLTILYQGYKLQAQPGVTAHASLSTGAEAQ